MRPKLLFQSQVMSGILDTEVPKKILFDTQGLLHNFLIKEINEFIYFYLKTLKSNSGL